MWNSHVCIQIWAQHLPDIVHLQHYFVLYCANDSDIMLIVMQLYSLSDSYIMDRSIYYIVTKYMFHFHMDKTNCLWFCDSYVNLNGTDSVWSKHRILNRCVKYSSALQLLIGLIHVSHSQHLNVPDCTKLTKWDIKTLLIICRLITMISFLWYFHKKHGCITVPKNYSMPWKLCPYGLELCT